MTNIELKIQAISLRKKGLSYSEIHKKINVGKSTLSNWLKEYPLNLTDLERSALVEKRVESYKNTIRAKNETRLSETYEVVSKELLPLSDKELHLCGLFLYWGEGAKNIRGQISLANTNPNVIKFHLLWVTKILKVPMSKVKVMLHLYSDMKIEDEIAYWSKELKLPLDRFLKPYIKQASLTRIKHKGIGHGTCTLLFGDVRLKEKIIMSLKAISDAYLAQ